MSLTPGTRFGAYDVGDAIGAGGMGEVYQATDSRLKRQVALKILAAAHVADDRLARLQREAEVLASLNHPHIAAIYGLEEAGGVTALVMEFVRGEDLSQRIARGALPLDEALPIARQIADALEAAHEQGIVHRDLKPANIKIRDDGTVKVLDFGLAKMLEPAAVAAGVSLPPTITSPVNTQLGTILGTAAYMSPEQARGKPADRRCDVWAFGCVLFEMLTGTRAFDGDEITDVLAAVVRDEPDWARVPAATPASIRRLLRRALTKDRRRRLADMADARLELDDTTSETPAPVNAATTRPRWTSAVPWLIAAAAVVAAAAFTARAKPTSPADLRVARFQVGSPSGLIQAAQPLSPDGRTLAFITSVEGKTQLWVRPLDSAVARMLPGTEGATRSFWSPDSQHVAFLADGNLMAAAIDGRAHGSSRAGHSATAHGAPVARSSSADNADGRSCASRNAAAKPLPKPRSTHRSRNCRTTIPSSCRTGATTFSCHGAAAAMARTSSAMSARSGRPSAAPCPASGPPSSTRPVVTWCSSGGPR